MPNPSGTRDDLSRLFYADGREARTAASEGPSTLPVFGMPRTPGVPERSETARGVSSRPKGLTARPSTVVEARTSPGSEAGSLRRDMRVERSPPTLRVQP